VNLDGPLRRPQLYRNLFVEQTSDDEGEHLTLPRGQGVKALLQTRDLFGLAPGPSGSSDGLINRLEQSKGARGRRSAVARWRPGQA
jgi:hypothetical protein